MNGNCWRTNGIATGIVTAAILCIALNAPAAGPGDAPDARSGAVTEGIVYRPPLRGAPGRRVGGASRGESGSGPVLVPLAPDHTGLSAADQPVLYWVQSGDERARVVVTLIDEESVYPLVEAEMTGPDGAGIRRFELSSRDVRLQPGVDYEWTVASVPDPTERSGDRIAGAFIRYAPIRTDTTGSGGGSAEVEARAYAGSGYWYDAFDVLTRAIEHDPGNARLIAQRRSLLEQIGIGDVLPDNP